MLPVIAPTVHVNVLGAVAPKAIPVAVLLQIATADGTPSTCGVGLTVTTIENGTPNDGHEPVIDVGVIIYSTVPAAELLGLVSVCAIVLPDPLLAPVIPPVIAPTVHVYVLGVVAFSAILVAVLLQIATAVGTPVICGVGLTVTVTTNGAADGQLPVVDVAVTKY